MHHIFLYYRNELYFCGFYRCVNSSESFTNWVKPEGLWVIRRSIHIDKIYKNYISFLIIPTLSSKSFFVEIIVHFRPRRNENCSEISTHGIYRSVKPFLQPIKSREISIMLKSWNYIFIKHMSIGSSFSKRYEIIYFNGDLGKILDIAWYVCLHMSPPPALPPPPTFRNPESSPDE